MILLLGGTSETAGLARGLADAGYDVLVSTATEISLDVGSHPRIQRRTGPLDEAGLTRLLREKEVRGIVDATHPYAALVREMTRCLARRLGLPYLTLIRPGDIRDSQGIFFAASHGEAAKFAFSQGRPVFLTTGAKHLLPYVWEAKKMAIPLYVRVLPEKASLEACRQAGVDEKSVIAARGPFSVEENRAVIRRFEIGVLVTKDSGKAGGTAEKLAAARQEGCRVVVVQRPVLHSDGAYDDPDALMQAVRNLVPRIGERQRPLS